MKSLLEMGLAVFMVLAVMDFVSAQTFKGEIGSSPAWNSGWFALEHPVSFRRGEILRLQVGGSATRVVVRFLPAGADPNEPNGIEDGVVAVPENRIVRITLLQDHPNVIQISVHGGPRAWDFDLGKNNGPATLLSAERLPR